MKIMVLGGTGFAGQRLVAGLIARGHQVSVVTRDAGSFALIEAAGARPILGSLYEADALVAAAGPQEMVINVARPPFEPQRYSRRQFARLRDQVTAMAATTITLCKKLDCPTIVTQGSAYATRGDEVADESWPLSLVGLTEMATDAIPLVEKALREGAPLLVMHPASIYGPGGLFLRQYYQAMKKGRYRVIGAGNNYFPWVHVDDLVAAYLLAVEKQPLGQHFILADDVPCTMREFGEHLAKCLGARRPGSVPGFVVRLVMGRYIHELVTMNCRVSNARARAVLGWDLRYPSYKEGIPASIAVIESQPE